MTKVSIAQETFEQAIQRELQEIKFYTNLAESIHNEGAKGEMLDIAKQEQKHADILKQRLKDIYGVDYKEKDEPLGKKYAAMGKEIKEHEHALVVAKTAIDIEEESIEFYSK